MSAARRVSGPGHASPGGSAQVASAFAQRRRAAGLGLMLAAVNATAVAAEPAPGHAFTKIANDGSALTGEAVYGSAPGDWACSRDDATGLVWEVKTRDGRLRDMNWTYTPYDSNPQTNGGYAGYKDSSSGDCLREFMEDASCNTEAYVSAVNATGLCGFSDWRLPTVSELVAVSHQTSDRPPTRTQRLLPNIANGWYWTGVERVGVTVFSRVILLPPYGRPAFYDGSYMVVVVRGPTDTQP